MSAITRHAAGSFTGKLDDLATKYAIQPHQIVAAVSPGQSTSHLAAKKSQCSEREFHDLLEGGGV